MNRATLLCASAFKISPNANANGGSRAARKFTNQLYQLNKANANDLPRFNFSELSWIKKDIDVQLGDHVQLMSPLYRYFATSRRYRKRWLKAKFQIYQCLLGSDGALPFWKINSFIDKYTSDGIMALFSGSADDAVKAGTAMLHLQHTIHRELGPDY